MTDDFELRDVLESDLATFFTQQLDAGANDMAAFTRKDPADREAFMAHWTRIRSDDTGRIQTVVFQGQVAGYVLSYQQDGETEVSYWLGTGYWGRGLATRALAAFLRLVQVRPLHARAAKDNYASLRVLEKCGFAIIGEDKGFSNARGKEVEEFLLKLEASQP